MDWYPFREPVNAWTHGLWMIVCIPASIHLQRRAGRSLLKHVGFAIYSVSLVLCFFGSWIYHAPTLGPVGLDLVGRIDYMGIFLLIAGTVTPVSLVLMRGFKRITTVLAFWAMASAGIAIRAFNVQVPDHASTGLYIMMGWMGLICYVELRRIAHQQAHLLWIGGLVYSIGALMNSVQWPTIVPGVFGGHEMFHLFVMIASACHYTFMLRVLAPYEMSGRHESIPEAVAA